MYDKKTVEAFLKNQLQLFPETVVDTEEEAAEFLEDVCAVVCKNKKEVIEYLEDERIHHLLLQFSIYETDEKQCKSNLTLLNYITNNSERKSLIKTVLLPSKPEIYEYTLCMVNKHEENENLSFISHFDLEDDENNINDSFDSCFNDHSVEQIEIKTKSNNKSFDNEDSEIDIEFEKDWNDILDSIIDKKAYQ